MADIAKVKRNIRRMLDQGAPDADIDAYIAEEGVTFEQLKAREATPASTPPRDISWSDVPRLAMENTPESAIEFGKAMVQPFMHPIQTLQSVGDLGAGALREGARRVLPAPVFNAIEGADPNPAAADRASQTAGAVGGFYKDRYGSMEGFKRALATDPVGVAGDAATVLTGGEMAAARLPGALSKAARPIGIAAEVMNPLTVPTKAARYATKYAVGPLAKIGFGLTSGAGYDNISEAFKAGKEGGEAGNAFRRNLRGKEGQAVAVADARKAIGRMVEERRVEYQNNMRAIKADQAPVNFDPIVHAYNEVWDSSFHNGHQRISDEAAKKLQKIGGILEEWQKDPSSHTAGGLDALKQRIDQEMPSFTEAGHSERIVTAVRNAIKDQIVQQAPDYASAMKAYEESKAIQDELERALSLGKDVSIDTTLRKLQSVTRNNANTNYGQRVAGVRELERHGAKNLMPKLSGQALSSKMPRGLHALVASGGLVGGLATGQLFNPLLWASLATTSPRLVGEASHLAGRVGRGLNLASKPVKKGLLGARAVGNAGLLGSR